MLDDFERLRQSRAFPRPTPAPPGSGGSAAFVGKVTTASPAVGKFCLVNPVVVTGTEGEGNAGTLTVDTGKSIAVYLMGPAAPATNDYIVCRNVDYRWVSVQTTPATTGPGVISGCVCQGSPAVIAMTSSNSACNGGGMFFSDTLTWQATPAAYAGLGLHDPGYYGAGTFTDASGFSFTYYLNCVSGTYSLTRLYPAQAGLSGAVVDSVRWSWPIGVSGNTCSPFAMTTGTIYTGGAAGCNVTLIHSP